MFEKGNYKMKTIILAALAAGMFAGVATAHPSNETHVCGIDPATLSEWPGYGTRDKIYDRGDYFFAVVVKDFTPSISYKGQKVESITTHYRVYKDDCRVSEAEIVHTESKDTVESDSRVAGVDYIVFSVSSDYLWITATYQGSTLQLEAADQNDDLDLAEENDITMRDFVDQLINGLNQASENGEDVTLELNSGSQDIPFSNMDDAWSSLTN